MLRGSPLGELVSLLLSACSAFLKLAMLTCCAVSAEMPGVSMRTTRCVNDSNASQTRVACCVPLSNTRRLWRICSKGTALGVLHTWEHNESNMKCGGVMNVITDRPWHIEH